YKGGWEMSQPPSLISTFGRLPGCKIRAYPRGRLQLCENLTGCRDRGINVFIAVGTAEEPALEGTRCQIHATLQHAAKELHERISVCPGGILVISHILISEEEPEHGTDRPGLEGDSRFTGRLVQAFHQPCRLGGDA